MPDSLDSLITKIYKGAIEEIDGRKVFDPNDTFKGYHDFREELRQELLTYSRMHRQSREARIARKALKEASYLRIHGSK